MLDASKRPEQEYILVSSIALNYDKLPYEVRDILNSVANNERKSIDLAFTISHYFDILPEEVKKLMYLMANCKNKSVVLNTALIIARFYNLFPIEANKIFDCILLKDPWIAIMALSAYKSKLSEDQRAVLESLRSNSYFPLISTLSSILTDEEAKRNLEYMLEDMENAYQNIIVILSNYDSLQSNVRNIFLEFAKNEKYAQTISSAIVLKYDEFPDSAKDILKRLLCEENTSEIMICVIIYFLHKESDSIAKLLYDLVNDETLGEYAIKFIAFNYHELSSVAQDFLYSMTHSKKTRKIVVKVLATNYNLASEVKDIIYSLANDDAEVKDILYSLSNDEAIAAKSIRFDKGMNSEDMVKIFHNINQNKSW